MVDLKGRIALVSGAARGLGLGIASTLGQAGATVLCVDVIPEIEESVKKLNAATVDARAIIANVSVEAEIRSLMHSIQDEYGHLDILVNNAGISPKNNGKAWLLSETTLDNWSQVMAVNLTGPFLMCREAIPLLRRGPGGRIINISSQSARTRPSATSGHYAASKAGLIGMSRSLANELGPLGITVNCIAPGIISSSMFNMFDEDKRRELTARVPLLKLGEPDDIGAAVCFLASDDAKYITGTTLDVNGGLFMT